MSRPPEYDENGVRRTCPARYTSSECGPRRTKTPEDVRALRSALAFHAEMARQQRNLEQARQLRGMQRILRGGIP